jgi:hypothetical protein
LESTRTLPTPETDFRETVSLAAAGLEAPEPLFELLLGLLPQALRPTTAPAASPRAAA